jgi:ribose-phosphate pyrophosphokinase
MTCDRFPDGEVKVQIQEDVRGADVFVVQPTTTNDFLMELLVIADALRRASASRVTAVVPYFGYARQDRKHEGRVPITAKLVANLMVTAGIHRVLTVDLHAQQIQGFFDVPVDHLTARPVHLDYLRSLGLKDPVVVSPDTGSIKIADRVAKALGASLAIIDKRRERANVSEVMHLIGDVRDKDCIIVDDLIDTAGTLCNAARAVMNGGARRVFACATHGVLSGPALQRIEESPLEQVVVTNSIAPSAEVRASKKIRYISIARLLGEAIRRIHNSDSVSSLFV